LTTLKFLYQDYKPQYYWWEGLEIVRKLLLTGVLVQFKKGSLVQTIMAMVIIVVHLVLLALFKPYKKARDGAIALFVYAMLLAVFFASLLLSVKTALAEGHPLRRGISATAVAIVLIFSVVSVLVAGVVVALDDICAVARYPTLQHKEDSRPVVFEHYSDPARFHLFLSHVWSTGQDQVLSIKKELLLIVPSLQIWLDVENLTNVDDLESCITNIDTTLMFLSAGYFKSWNCLRETRCAIAQTVPALRVGEAKSELTRQGEALRRHRSSLGIPLGGSSIILVRETDEQYHGGLSKTELLERCPEQIGCKDHVFIFDADCQGCCDCPINIKLALQAHSDGPGGMIDWLRYQDFKIISLKQIVQQMLLVMQPGGGALELSIPGELSGTSWEMPRCPRTRVLVHRGCHLSDELPDLLQQIVPGMAVALLDDGGADEVPQFLADAAAQAGRRVEVATHLLVVVHDKCFDNARVVTSLQFALTNKIAVALLHEADAEYGGCPFGSIVEQCPLGLRQISGFSGMKLFGPIAVQWSRGPHQSASIRLLAKSLGAVPAQQQRGIIARCRLSARSQQLPAGWEGRSGGTSGIELNCLASDEAIELNADPADPHVEEMPPPEDAPPPVSCAPLKKFQAPFTVLGQKGREFLGVRAVAWRSDERGHVPTTECDTISENPRRALNGVTENPMAKTQGRGPALSVVAHV
jgi:hypothetical protein